MPPFFFKSHPSTLGPEALAFRDAFDTATIAIEPFARSESNRAVDPSIREMVLKPIIAERQMEENIEISAATPPDEHANFAGLAAALTTFRAAVAAIALDDKHAKHQRAVLAATDSLTAIAQRHAAPTDDDEPSDDSATAKEFSKAVLAWEDTTAGLADSLGL